MKASASCKLSYLYFYIYRDNFEAVCVGTSYDSTTVSCKLNSALNNGDYHYYMYWYGGSNNRFNGYLYDYNEFKVVNAEEKDTTAPYAEGIFVDPFFGSLDVSGSSGGDKIVAMLGVSDTEAGYQSGVGTIHADVYDFRYGHAILFIVHVGPFSVIEYCCTSATTGSEALRITSTLAMNSKVPFCIGFARIVS
jgi:hypothetical protein